jgi:hypothetical protein
MNPITALMLSQGVEQQRRRANPRQRFLELTPSQRERSDRSHWRDMVSSYRVGFASKA